MNDLTSSDIPDYISHALKYGDSSYIAYALGVCADLVGITSIEGMTQDDFKRAFSTGGEPTIGQMMSLLSLLRVQFVEQNVEFNV